MDLFQSISHRLIKLAANLWINLKPFHALRLPIWIDDYGNIEDKKENICETSDNYNSCIELTRARE